MFSSTRKVPLVDIGANLISKRFSKDLDAVLSRAVDAGLREVVVTGTSLKDSKAAKSFCIKYNQNELPKPKLFYTCGVHPHDAKTLDDNAFEQLKSLVLSEDGPVAVGECGLDYNRMFSPKEDQISAFERQLDLAVEAKLPVFLHERDAFEDFYRILKSRRDKLTNVVVHCFTGSAESLNAYLDLDCHIGITGWIASPPRGDPLFQLISERKPSTSRLMIETDCPFLLPKNMPSKPKNRRCEPAHLPFVLFKVFEAYGLPHDDDSFESFANEIYNTSVSFFKLH